MSDYMSIEVEQKKVKKLFVVRVCSLNVDL